VSNRVTSRKRQGLHGEPVDGLLVAVLGVGEGEAAVDLVEIRTVIYTTNAIESLNARFRRAVKARGHFPTEQAALKHLYLTICSLDPDRSRPATLDQPLEGRTQRIRYHLRRTHPHQQVEGRPTVYFTVFTEPHVKRATT
jgi:hypothetical protein